MKQLHHPPCTKSIQTHPTHINISSQTQSTNSTKHKHKTPNPRLHHPHHIGIFNTRILPSAASYMWVSTHPNLGKKIRRTWSGRAPNGKQVSKSSTLIIWASLTPGFFQVLRHICGFSAHLGRTCPQMELSTGLFSTFCFSLLLPFRLRDGGGCVLRGVHVALMWRVACLVLCVFGR